MKADLSLSTTHATWDPQSSKPTATVTVGLPWQIKSISFIFLNDLIASTFLFLSQVSNSLRIFYPFFGAINKSLPRFSFNKQTVWDSRKLIPNLLVIFAFLVRDSAKLTHVWALNATVSRYSEMGKQSNIIDAKDCRIHFALHYPTPHTHTHTF